ncbi:MAG: glycoside hydrolase family 99-like domain-containing protein [Pseudomonadota bacterium]
MTIETRVIAFYLPQFHPIPENDAWWGTGFTEWTNVTRAKPLFPGHAQPRLPADLGFYDLRLPEVRAAQAELARAHGIHGFCYHYYWFKGGKRLLERPLNEVLSSGQPDFPFCLCWANENWTRRWDGQEQEILMAQAHTPDSDLAFLRDVLPIFKDPRYIRVNGRPLLVIYRATLLPDMAATVRRWQAEAHCHGEQAPYLVAAESFDVTPAFAHSAGLDATCEFPPHGASSAIFPQRSGLDFNGPFSGQVLDYEKLATHYMARPESPLRRFKTVTLDWDNTARKKWAATLTIGFSLDHYHHWLSHVLRQARDTAPPDERIVFINAWNEWAEGTYLEPDQRHGHAYLEATRAAIFGLPWSRRAPEPIEVAQETRESASVPRAEIRSVTGAVPEAPQAATGHTRFKLVVVAMVANEADIIEAFVLENLRFADHMIIACHRPLDGTREILEALVERGLPVRLHDIQTLAFDKAGTIHRLVCEAVEDLGADWVIPLDADEFVDGPDRAGLEAALAALGPTHAWVPWLNHVPTAMDDPAEPHPLKRIQHRYVYPIPTPTDNVFVWKVMLRSELIRPYLRRYELMKGAHRLVFRSTNEPCHQPIAVLDGVYLRHFPVRSPEQMALKVGIGRLGRALLGGHQAEGGVHWDSIWSGVSRGDSGLSAMQSAVRTYLDTGRLTSEQLADTTITLDPMPVSRTLTHLALKSSAATVALKWSASLLDHVSSGRLVSQQAAATNFFILSTGRCGSTTIRDFLNQARNCHCVHEPEPQLIAEATRYAYGEFDHREMVDLLRTTRPVQVEGKRYGESNLKLSFVFDALDEAFPQASYVWLLRDGRETVASMHARGWYTQSSELHAWERWRIQGDRVGDVSVQAWMKMTPFEKCCWYWTYVNRLIQRKLNRVADRSMRVRVEYLQQASPQVFGFLELTRPDTAIVGKANVAMAHHRPEHYSAWPEEQVAMFKDYCGSAMDEWYPGWDR